MKDRGKHCPTRRTRIGGGLRSSMIYRLWCPMLVSGGDKMKVGGQESPCKSVVGDMSLSIASDMRCAATRSRSTSATT